MTSCRWVSSSNFARLHSGLFPHYSTRDTINRLLVQDRIEFLKADMVNLFTADGPDKSAYEDHIVFRDPISTYSSLSSAPF
jgi:hypothetical protein